MAECIWKWHTALHEGRLVRRYERFIAEVELEGHLVGAHCVNPGRMEGLVIPGARVWLSEAPGRALPWTWELIEFEGRLVGANTLLPNRLVAQVLERKLLSGFSDVTAVHAERKFGRGHRVDFVLDRPNGQHYLEVKNCHLVYPDACGYFPDSVSERATAHVEALTRLVKKGVPATVLFTLQRDDARALRPSALHDSRFASAMRRAVKAGLDTRAVRLVPTLEGVFYEGEVPVDVSGSNVAMTSQWSQTFDATSGWQRKDGRWSGRSFIRP